MKRMNKALSLLSAAVLGCSMLLPVSAQAAGILGDVDGNSIINAEDATEILKEAARRGAGTVNKDAAFEAAADVNKDGKITADDALEILKYASKVGTGKMMASLEDYLNYQKAGYTPSYKTRKVYGMDMTQQKDDNFNGEFLTLTFMVKDAAIASRFPVRIVKTDVASWEKVVTLHPEIIQGEVGIGVTPNTQPTMVSKDFCMKVNSTVAQKGGVVNVTVNVSGNPGFCGYILDVAYDQNAMELASVATGKDYHGIAELN